jgi:exopolysaccharide biosynthesis WecB/TagA/CpsF family protein
MLARSITVNDEYVRIFGIKFLKGGYDAARKKLAGGGFMVVPSAPSLVPIKADDYYYQALKQSDFAIPDSGLMVLTLRFFFRIRLERVSGLEFLAAYLADLSGRDHGGIFLVEPTTEDHDANQRYLYSTGVRYRPEDYYIAPIYSGTVIRDFELLNKIESARPSIVLINLGGGVQERVGYFLKENLTYKPAIICTGAAIAFMSGRQVEIPVWADYFYLGWLYRCFSNPARFIPRYLGSLQLIPMLLSCTITK